MLNFPNHAVSAFFERRAATEQGGLLSGKDPSAVNPADPLRLWIIQVGIIVCTATLLSLVLSKIRQPKVIAEVLGGIILGPTAFGQIPGFTAHIFPQDSRPYLTLVANIGLVLFLFLVGLEIDGTVIKRNARLSATVALAGMILPFGIGAGVAHGVYEEFIDPSIKFTYFMLFTGVAYSITAFPVLCRILTELKLLDTTVGIVVLSAGVGNDIIGWILLALSVALVNASNGLTALYILLACVGWTIFLLFPVRMALFWLARKTGSIESGPSVFFMTVTIMIVFGSAFFTDVIGVHAIFGAFVAGLIVPREGNLAIIITEKLEDIVSIIFLPLYFTLSGLSTDLTLLDNGVTWGYTIAIIVTAFVGKFGGCMIAARYVAGFNWRESSTIGSLMSCKGLVELIVLNVGLQAKILSPRVFSMFVLEALVLTFMTTPLVTWLYPPHLRRRISATGGHFDNVADDEGMARKKPPLEDGEFRTRFTVVLDKLEHVPGMMALTQLVQPTQSSHRRISIAPSESSSTLPSMFADALRLIELSDRVSAVMRSSNAEYLLHTDPLLSIFRMFGQLNGIRVAPAISVVKFDDLAYSVAEHARNHDSDMIFIPWLPPVQDSTLQDANPPPSTPMEQPITLPDSALSPPIMNAPTKSAASHNPFDMLFKSAKSPHGSSTPVAPVDVSNSVAITHSQFVRGVFSQSTTDVALFVDQSTLDSMMSNSIVGGGTGGGGGYQQHIFLPFFGGPDDRLALEFAVQICSNPKIKGTIVRILKTDDSGDTGAMGIATPTKPSNAHIENSSLDPRAIEELNRLTVTSVFTYVRIAGMPDTYYGQHNTETRLQSDTADNIIWTRYSTYSQNDGASTSSGSAARPQLDFVTLNSPIPLHAAIQQATESIPTPSTKLVVVTGRSRRMAVENHRMELKQLMDEHGHVGAEVRKTIGDVATAFVVAGVGSGVVVLQAAGPGNID
ncbi:Sodium/hydrogen exchanger family-domain-containing protein [Crepidotus variabilis]|uniref:Sodium/hydrogen exchanger family-domain-containing protein n=1 Tax=Crepidotus variabilis TaxID=179855 RepID=A0A9P6EB87_9AGAR|nr:Sodium/hydrogen exchanger family-domain-containing protein [Crepidotus variabilis]